MAHSTHRASFILRPTPILGVLVLAGGTGVLRAQPASFQGLGTLPGLAHSSAVALSADGTTVVGPDGTVASTHPFRWTAATGWTAIFAQVFYWWATGVSADGSVVVGTNDQERPVRWAQATGAVAQGTVQGYALYNVAQGVSADGQVMAGEAARETNVLCASFCPGSLPRPLRESTAFRQLGAGAPLKKLAPLPGFSSSAARGVSGDGSVVAGHSFNWVCNACGWSFVGSRQACVWLGTGGPPLALAFLPGVGNSTARAVSADGLVVVGTDGGRAFRWTVAGSTVDLGASDPVDSARAVSADGAIVVGRDSTFEAFIWDPRHGVRDLRNVLQAELGLNLTGWTLTAANGISGDGRTIAGSGINPAGQPEAWIAFLGDGVCYVDCNTDGALTVADFGCFQTKFVAGDPYADCNADGQLTVADFGCFQTRFVTGCP